MEKRGAILTAVIIFLFLISFVSASSIDEEIKKMTNYAEEYETGNINYVQLLLYTSSIKQNLNEILGATEKEYGGILKQEQLKPLLGEPTEETKWVWVESEEREKKLDESIPVWRKIVFDGKKIQIRLNAWPSIFKKKKFKESGEKEEFKEEGTEKKFEELEEKLVYRLNFEINFKKPEEQLDIEGKIKEIQVLAQNFNSAPTNENAEVLAKESVNAERTFESFFKQKQEKCEDIMKSIFGAENQRATQKMFIQEFSFYSSENFEIIARIEMCDDCEWHWVYMESRLEGRGPGFKMPKDTGETFSPQSFKNLKFEDFEEEIRKAIDELKQAIESKNYENVYRINNKIRALNEAWNQKSNDLWPEVDKIFEAKRATMSQEEMQKFNENYGWLKEDQEKRKKVMEMEKENYEKRKSFYLDLFSSYEKKEYYFEQIEFEKRLIEEFKEFGKEICDNNKDDNENGEVDCNEDQCGGKICGWTEIEIKKAIQNTETQTIENSEVTESTEIEENVEVEAEQFINTTETIETTQTSIITGDVIEETETAETENETGVEQEIEKKKTPLYCINKVCQLKEEIIEEKIAICGNHICEENEKENCAEDCSICQEHPPLECAGKVIFKGKDKNNCPLEPICLEDKPCQVNEDCRFLCGEGECIEGKCKVKELKECTEAECVDGDEKIVNCEAGEKIVTEKCINSLWVKTDIECETKEENVTIMECESYCATQPHLTCLGHSEISGVYPDCNCNWICGEGIAIDECATRDDCGSLNDVCSNGKCVTIPQKEEIVEEIKEPEVIEETKEQETTSVTETPSAEPTSAPETSQSTTETVPEVPEIPSEQPSSSEITEPTPTGAFIFAFLGSLLKNLRIARDAITGFETEEASAPTEEAPIQTEPIPSQEQTSPTQSTRPEPIPPEQTPPEPQNPPEGQLPELQPGQQNPPPEQMQQSPQQEQPQPPQEQPQDNQQQREEEQRRREEENKERCKKECIRPCVEKCTREKCGEKMDCNVDETIKLCEQECKPEENCIEKCMKGGDWWQEYQETPKQEKGVFQVGGTCRTSQGKTEGFIWFGGWGDPFEKIQYLKPKYYLGGQADWCKQDLENLKKRRKAFEQGFNQEFVTWFFEKYLANSAEDWEQQTSGIFEIYWNNVDTIREMTFRLDCLDEELNEAEFNLISVNYSTEYGSLEFWEEIKSVKMPGLDKEVKVINPYMKIWIFPPKSFIIYEMKQAMKEHEFPGSSEDKMERKNEEGPTAEEKEVIKQDKSFMKKIQKISEKYGGSLDVVIEFKDYQTNEVIFNLYAQVNENDIIKLKPMLPEEVPSKDVKAEIDFEKIYDLIYFSEKEMQGGYTESPPWDKKSNPVGKIKEAINGVKMYFKVRSILNSAKVSPPEAKSDVQSLSKTFFFMMQKAGQETPSEEEMQEEGQAENMEEDVLGSKEEITGEIIRG